MGKTHIAEFNKVYESSLDVSRIAAEDLNSYWRLLGIDVDLTYQLELCMVEMVNNTFIHAYNKQLGFPIELKCGVIIEGDKKRLFIFISDQGEGMIKLDLEKKLASHFIEADPEIEATWATSGRGFLIVSSLMDKIELSVSEGINTFVMTKTI